MERSPVESPAASRVCAGTLRVALRRDVGMEPLPPDGLAFRCAYGRVVTFRRLPSGALAGLSAMAAGRHSVADLSDVALADGGRHALLRFYHHMAGLQATGFLDHTAVAGQRALATITGTGRGYRFTAHTPPPTRRFVLSRFAYVRPDGGQLVLESPLGHARVVLHGPESMALLALLATESSAADIAARLPGITVPAALDMLELLLNAAALTVPGDGPAGGTAEATDPARALWDFHDLLFHARSRHGRHTGPFGAGARHIGDFPPLPAVRPVPDGPVVDLPRADLDRLAAWDVPFTAVLEARRSARAFGARPIDIDRLGRFLHRVAAVRRLDTVEVTGSGGTTRTSMEVSSRPYPSGGRCYELEFYVCVERCEGLDAGLYHYDPLGHRLTGVRGSDPDVVALFRYASVAAPVTAPQVLVCLAARFQRVSWKYDAIAYATTLKHVGVVMQTMYLVATAMGLAGCALGSGDSDLFAAAAGTDYLVETSVGEFLLGTPGGAGTPDWPAALGLGQPHAPEQPNQPHSAQPAQPTERLPTTERAHPTGRPDPPRAERTGQPPGARRAYATGQPDGTELAR